MDEAAVIDIGAMGLNILAIIAAAFFITWITKIIFQKLQARYERQKRIWAETFCMTIYEPLRWFIWFFALVYIASSIFSYTKMTFAQDLVAMVEEVGGVLALWWFLTKWKRLFVQRMITKSRAHEIVVDPAKIDAIDKICTLAILLSIGLLLLEATGRSFSTILAFGGIGGLALAFASQEIIANFFGGFMIYITRPFAIGDWIHIPELSVEGVVEQIGWYTTHIRSLDKQPMYIPNSLFNKQVVVTRSRMSHREIKEIVGVRSEDYSKLRTITDDIEQQLRKHPDIDHDETIVVRFNGYGAYTLDIYVRAYTNKVDTHSYMRVKESILFIIGDTIARHGAEIPNPSQNIVLQKSQV